MWDPLKKYKQNNRDTQVNIIQPKKKVCEWEWKNVLLKI